MVKCYNFMHVSLQEPIAVATYLISVTLLGFGLYYLVIRPFQKDESQKNRIIKGSIFVFLFLFFLFFLPYFKEQWYDLVRRCMEIRMDF